MVLITVQNMSLLCYIKRLTINATVGSQQFCVASVEMGQQTTTKRNHLTPYYPLHVYLMNI